MILTTESDERLVTARMAMMGLISSQQTMVKGTSEVAKHAIAYADALLREHRKTLDAVELAHSTSSNSDYAAALRGISDYRNSEGDSGGSIDHLKVWLQSRLNSAKAPNCA